MRAILSRDWQSPNHGIACWGSPKPDAVLAITGLCRSGTTSAAEMVASLIPLAFDGLNNLEHYALAERLQANDSSSAKEIVGSGRFSFKIPSLWRYETTLREAAGDRLAWIVTTRDTTAVSLRESDWHKQDVEKWMAETWRANAQMGEWFLGLADPKVIISAEKLLTDRVSIRMQLSAWLKGELVCE